MYCNVILCRSVLAVLLFGSIDLSAQELVRNAIRTESGIDFIPELRFELRHDDNIANAPEAERSSWISLLTPKLTAQLLSGPNEYQAALELASGSYLSSSDDSYLDWNFSTAALVELSDRHRFDVKGRYAAAHEARGTGITEGQGNALTEPADVRLLSVQGAYEYGAQSSRTRLRLSTSYFDKDYRNYEALTQFRTYHSIKLGTELYYNTGANTRLITEISRLHTRYDTIDISGSRDSDTMNYRLGVRWQPSELTSAELRLGYQNRQFDNPQRQDFSGLAWEMAVQWAPLSYSRFNLSTGRQSKEPDTQGDFVKETHYSLFWTHQWQPLFSSSLGVKRTNDDYTGFDRRDRLTSYQLSGKYSLLPQLLLNAGIRLHRNNSSVANIEFDKNEVFFAVQLAL